MARRERISFGRCRQLALVAPLIAGVAQAALADGAFDAATALVRKQDFAGAAALLGADPGAEAQFLLAGFYRSGRGVSRDAQRAFALTKAAADAGLVSAQYVLASYYAEGVGTPRDTGLAFEWAAKAAAGGDQRAASLLVSLSTAPQDPAPVSAAKPAAVPVPADPANLVDSARRNRAGLVDQLVAAGVAVDATDASGQTALMAAAATGAVDALQHLLTAGARPAVNAAQGESVLSLAAASGRASAVAMLIGAGAQVTPNVITRGFGKQDCALLRTLTNAAPDDALKGYATATSAWVAQRCSADDFKAFVAAGLPLDAPDPLGRGLLWYAASAGNAPVVALLIAGGSDAATADSQGIAPIGVAAQSGSADTVSALLSAGAGVDTATGKDADTPLILAASRGATGAVQQLLNAGAEIDHRNAQGDTALIVAARSGQADAVVMLLQAGADASLRNQRRERAQDAALAAGHPQVATLMP